MDVSIPDSLTSFVAQRVRAGGYPNADAFIEELVRAEAGAMEGAARGQALPVDAHFDRRLEALLDDGALSGDYTVADSAVFDRMELEALALLAQKKTS